MTVALLPSSLDNHELTPRLRSAVLAVRGAGAAISVLRNAPHAARDLGDQLKTAIDRAAEGWVLGYLAATFPRDPFLAEERYSDDEKSCSGEQAYWTIDALDGTRSYIDGYDGFTVQVSYVCDGAPVLAAIDEPARRTTWLAMAAHGAFVRQHDDGTWTRLARTTVGDWPQRPRFVESKAPSQGPVFEMMTRHRGEFVECGGVGAKALRVASGDADVFAKNFAFKLWDVAPVDLVLRETGCLLGTFEGEPIAYRHETVSVAGVLAAPASLYNKIVQELATRR